MRRKEGIASHLVTRKKESLAFSSGGGGHVAFDFDRKRVMKGKKKREKKMTRSPGGQKRRGGAVQTGGGRDWPFLFKLSLVTPAKGGAP